MTRGWRARLCPRCSIMEEAEWSYWRTPTCKDKSTDFGPSRKVRSLPFTRASPLRTRVVAAVHARRRTRIIHVRATTEFVGHAVDRGESRARGLNVIGRWLRTMLLDRCSARARLIPRVSHWIENTDIHLCTMPLRWSLSLSLCRYQFTLVSRHLQSCGDILIYQKIWVEGKLG